MMFESASTERSFNVKEKHSWNLWLLTGLTRPAHEAPHFIGLYILSPTLPASAPKLKPMKNPIIVEEGSKLIVKCEAKGNPANPTYTWFKDGNELKKSRKIRIRNSLPASVVSRRKNSRVQINGAQLEDSGNYTCVVENPLGKDNSTGTVNVQSCEYRVLGAARGATDAHS
ncbi:Pro-neuregulin-2, membrane-bound isoform [Liparis tanakae]|uniref:Pro-neuregulin-2, membrane-bound isoform n=1 Tax=Liparis tanakae TaxID=230148 RepID=A0A4Z2FW64_9TELE|nr:Pro-neuregulin-2, membrane-bound isoform [Liparis tanakae]